MTLTEIREALAAALSGVEGLNIRPRPTVKMPKVGDGWVTVGRMEPSDFRRSSVTLIAVILLGADEASAEDLLETFAVDIIDAATMADFSAGNVALEPFFFADLSLHAVTLTLTTEVESNV